MNSEDIHIRSWGELTDEYLGPAFIRKFEEGDILYGSRRTYLKKVAVAHFKGITSNTTFVIKPNEELMHRGLLPFIMLSDAFTDHSIKNSKGSVNPYINWKDLAKYELLIPPKDQQSKIAELLGAMDNVVEGRGRLLSKIMQFYNSSIDNLFLENNSDWDIEKLDKVAKVNHQSLNSKTDPNLEFHYLDISSIKEPKVIGEMEKMSFEEAPSRAKRIVDDNSIVLSLVRPYLKSFAFVEKGNGIIASTGTGVISDSDVDIRFLYHQFFSKRFEMYCEDRMTGTNYPAINQTDLKQYPVLFPKDEKLQKKYGKQFDLIEQNINSIKLSLDHSKNLLRGLINQIF